jgi:hypothetical protein
VATCRWTLTQPWRGVVVVVEKLLLPVLPLNRPLGPQQRLVTVHAVRKDFFKDGPHGFLVDRWQAITPTRTGPNIYQHVVGDAARTHVSTVKVQICGTRPVEAVRWVFKKWSTWRWISSTRHSTWIRVALSKGRSLIARLTLFRSVQRIRKVLGIYMVQERDLDRISHTRPQRRARARDTMSVRPHGSAEWGQARVIAGEIAHASGITTRSRLSR